MAAIEDVVAKLQAQEQVVEVIKAFDSASKIEVARRLALIMATSDKYHNQARDLLKMLMGSVTTAEMSALLGDIKVLDELRKAEEEKKAKKNKE